MSITPPNTTQVKLGKLGSVVIPAIRMTIAADVSGPTTVTVEIPLIYFEVSRD